MIILLFNVLKKVGVGGLDFVLHGRRCWLLAIHTRLVSSSLIWTIYNTFYAFQYLASN